MTVSLCADNPLLEENAALFEKVLSEDSGLLGERYTILAWLLTQMDYR